MSLRAWALNGLLRVAAKRKLSRLRVLDARAVAAVRANLARSAAWLPPLPADVSVTPVDAGGVAAEWVASADASPRHVLLYLHGGAYLCGNPRLYRDLAARLSAACAARVLVPDYRLAPEHPFPAAPRDALGVWHWLTERVAPGCCALGGDSAGGGLALAVLAAARDAGGPMPAAAFAFSPWTDLTGGGPSVHGNARSDPWLPADLLDSAARLYLGSAPADHPLASPLFADLHDLPPLLLHVVASEILLDDTLRLTARARSAGVSAEHRVWQGLPHAFPIFAPLLPEARRCIEATGAFVRSHWG